MLYLVRCITMVLQAQTETHVQNWLNVKNSRDQSQHRRLDTHRLENRFSTDLRLKLCCYSWSLSTAEDTSGTTCSSSEGMVFFHFLTVHFMWLLHQNHQETICSHRKEWHQHRDSQKVLPKWGVSDIFPVAQTKLESYEECKWQPYCLVSGFQGTGNHQEQLETLWTCAWQLL